MGEGDLGGGDGTLAGRGWLVDMCYVASQTSRFQHHTSTATYSVACLVVRKAYLAQGTVRVSQRHQVVVLQLIRGTELPVTQLASCL